VTRDSTIMTRPYHWATLLINLLQTISLASSCILYNNLNDYNVSFYTCNKFLSILLPGMWPNHIFRVMSRITSTLNQILASKIFSSRGRVESWLDESS